MSARELYRIGDRVRIARPGRSVGAAARAGTVVAPWPQLTSQVRVRRDNGSVTVDGARYWQPGARR